MPILNYTTKVPPEKTVSQIQSILGTKADAVMTEYANGKPTAVLFAVNVAGQRVNFRMPCNVDGVYKALWNQRGVPHSLKNRDHAERVAWRIVKDWIEAQLALVEAGQAQLAEVFLPYAVTRSGQTMFQAFENQQRQLTAGDDESEERA